MYVSQRFSRLRRAARNSQWGGLGAKPPAAEGTGVIGNFARNFCVFLQNELNFRAILIKNNAFKTWRRNWQRNMIQLVALMGYIRSG